MTPRMLFMGMLCLLSTFSFAQIQFEAAIGGNLGTIFRTVAPFEKINVISNRPKELPIIGASVKFDVSYNFNKKVGLGSGIGLKQFGYASNQTNSDGYRTRVYYNNLYMPILFRYSPVKNMVLAIGTGLSLNACNWFAVGPTLYTKIKGYRNFVSYFGIAADLSVRYHIKKFFLSLGYTCYFTNHNSYNINTTSDYKVIERLQGLEFAIGYRFGKKQQKNTSN